ncbi:hypothetical protein AHAS_Ahas13G0292400 [Arachis hypogaea]|uniref:Small ribosomal subunit protein uS7 domain-containing protein n=1 Tax=Arachis hypogaea TaxID=3818 RepID=A0A445A0S1_ARAHY|nr:hypothetical protein Ahy_B03g065028 [Arachis hypogaea]
MGGMAIPMPKIFTIFSILSMASLALPGMSGFVAKLMIFFVILTSQKYLLMTKILIIFLNTIGIILTPIYSLSMLRQMFYGYKLFNTPNSYFFYSGPRELFISISILMPVISIGIYPDFIFSFSVDKTETNPLSVLHQAIRGVTPDIAVKARRVGGSTHQVPIEIGSTQGKALAIHWLLGASRKRPGRNMAFKLSSELVDAAKGSGDAIRKKEETHRMARQIELLHIFVNP